MCSIFGIYLFNSKISDEWREKFENATTILYNRGPDEYNYYESVNCIIGGNRLVIRGNIGLGSMPFCKDSMVCYYNGEIYNYKDFGSIQYSDGEIILPSYIEYGERVFKNYIGEFAISILNKNNEVILVRDQFGTKPLYFYCDNEKCVWASSSHVIRKICGTINTPQIPLPNTIHKSYQEPYSCWKNIFQIPPGHLLKINKKLLTLSCYHQFQETNSAIDDISIIKEELISSLKDRFDYQGIIGIAMSGGIDSGIIAFMAEQLNINYEIFTIPLMFGKKTIESNNIFERIKRLKNANAINIINFTQNDIDEALDTIFKEEYYDFLIKDSAVFPTFLIYKHMRQRNIRVAIVGEGGDELFHGYPYRASFVSPPEWPNVWNKKKFYNSIRTSLLGFTAKNDRAGAYYSIETRYPYQDIRLFYKAEQLKIKEELKWPLRKFLSQYVQYGHLTDFDKYGKIGFSLKNYKLSHKEFESILSQKWYSIFGYPETSKSPFPFIIGKTSVVTI